MDDVRGCGLWGWQIRFPSLLFPGLTTRWSGQPPTAACDHAGQCLGPAFTVIDGPIHSRAFLSRIHEVVEIRGPLSQSQFDELKFVAEHCPIGETLRQGLKIEEQVVLLPDVEEPKRQARRALRLFDGPEQATTAAASAGSNKA